MGAIGAKQSFLYFNGDASGGDPDGVFNTPVAGSVSAAIMANLVKSLIMPHGGVYVTASAATTCTVQSTMYPVNCTTAAATSSSLEEVTAATLSIDGSVTPALRYTGSATRHFTVHAALSVSCSANNQNVSFQVYKVDSTGVTKTALAHSKITRTIGTGADRGAIALLGDVTLVQNEYIIACCANDTSAGATVTAAQMVLHMGGIFE